MLLEGFTHRCDSITDTITHPAFAKCAAHDITNSIPKIFSYLGVDSLITDDCKFTTPHRDIEQHSIALPGLIHLETFEDECGPFQGIPPAASFHMQANFTGSIKFRIPNRIDDALHLLIAKVVRTQFSASIPSTNFRLRRLRRTSRHRR